MTTSQTFGRTDKTTSGFAHQAVVPVLVRAVPLNELLDAPLNGRRRFVVEKHLCFGDIGVGVFGVTSSGIVVDEV